MPRRKIRTSRTTQTTRRRSRCKTTKKKTKARDPLYSQMRQANIRSVRNMPKI